MNNAWKAFRYGSGEKRAGVQKKCRSCARMTFTRTPEGEPVCGVHDPARKERLKELRGEER